MAYMTTIFCTQCNESKNTIVGAGDSPSLICDSCRLENKDKERKEYFASLDKLPLEERIRKIEEWIYEYRPTHVPPPMY